MKKVLIFAALIVLSVGLYSFMSSKTQTAESVEKLKWYTWEEAVEANKKVPKKMFIDVYTDWCHWCKVMDQKTFSEAGISEYLSKNFYPVKLNAEQRADIQFNGQKFGYVQSGNRGVHTLAYSLLDGQMSYPTTVMLNEKFERVLISPGFKKPDDLIKELRFVAEEHYKTTSWDKFSGQN